MKILQAPARTPPISFQKLNSKNAKRTTGKPCRFVWLQATDRWWHFVSHPAPLSLLLAVDLLVLTRLQLWPERTSTPSSLRQPNFHGKIFSSLLAPMSLKPRRYHIGESMLPSLNSFMRFIGAEEKLRDHGFTTKVCPIPLDQSPTNLHCHSLEQL